MLCYSIRMTLLADRDLFALGPTLVQPFDPAHVQPASIDVHLDKDLLVEDGAAGAQYHSDPALPAEENFVPVPLFRARPYFLLETGSLVLGSTFETITVPNGLAARFEGKSSLGRLGLITHVTAGFIDPGFSGQITVEMTKIGHRPLVLHAGMKIGQVCFYRLSREAEHPYGSAEAGSHYQGQRGPQVSRSHERFKTIDVFGDSETHHGQHCTFAGMSYEETKGRPSHCLCNGEWS